MRMRMITRMRVEMEMCRVDFVLCVWCFKKNVVSISIDASIRRNLYIDLMLYGNMFDMKLIYLIRY